MFPIEARIQLLESGAGNSRPKKLVDVPDQPEACAVHEAPHERRHDRGHRVWQEDRDAEERGKAEPAAVDRERGDQGDAEHDGHLHDEEEEDPPERVPELRVDEGLGIVLEADEARAADQLFAEQAEEDRVRDWGDEAPGRIPP